MKIYLDYIFIENLIIDFIILYETALMAKIKVKHKWLIAAATLSSIYVVLMIVFKIEELMYVISKIILMIVMVYIAFRPNRMVKLLKLSLLCFIASIINVGSITVVLNLLGIKQVTGIHKILVYLVGLSISKISVSDMWRLYKLDLKSNDLIYNVTINTKNNQYIYNAFLDTGNNVYSYSYGVPIIFAELKDNEILNELQGKEKIEIETVTLSNKSKKIAYLLDDIEVIKGKEKYKVKAGVVFEKTKFSRNNSYNMILNYILFENSIGGIKI